MMNESQDGHEALLATGADDGAPMTDSKSGSTLDEKPEMQVAGTCKADKNAQNTAAGPNVLKIKGLHGEMRMLRKDSKVGPDGFEPPTKGL